MPACGRRESVSGSSQWLFDINTEMMEIKAVEQRLCTTAARTGSSG